MPKGLIVGEFICGKKDAFEETLERLDIQIATSKTREELLVDFKTKYKDVKVLYLSLFCAKVKKKCMIYVNPF